MKRIAVWTAAVLAVSSMMMTACADKLPVNPEEAQTQLKEKIADELKSAFTAQMEDFFQSDDLGKSLGFSAEQLEEMKQSVAQYMEEYEFDEDTMTEFTNELQSLFDETQGLSKEEIQSRLDEMMK